MQSPWGLCPTTVEKAFTLESFAPYSEGAKSGREGLILKTKEDESSLLWPEKLTQRSVVV